MTQLSPQALELSRELAGMLGQTPEPVVRNTRLGPLVAIKSKSKPDHTYLMAYAPVSGWVHADSTCPAFKECWHRREAERIMTSLVVRGQTDMEISERPVLLVEYDAQQLSAGVDPAIAAKWAYNLPGIGQGVGVRGVEEGTRAMASRGEVIRVDQVVVVHQDEREAFFSATASRYVVGTDGSEVKLDSQTRGKRVPKWEPTADKRGEYFVKAWYELGVVKASRNAALAMMPSNVKTALLRAGLDAQAAGGSRPQQARPAPTRKRVEPSANVDRETGEVYEATQATEGSGGKAAEPASSPTLSTEAQQAAIADWSAQIRDLDDGKQRLVAVDRARREAFTYAVVDGNKFSASKLNQADAESYISLLKEAYEAKAPEVQQPALAT